MYVYRFINNNNTIIYVGKANNINIRISQHFSNAGHLLQECYAEVERIEYIELPTKIDMDIKELYYINKWKPKYNIINKQEEELGLIINDCDIWIVYTTKFEKYKQLLDLNSEKFTFSIPIKQEAFSKRLVANVTKTQKTFVQEMSKKFENESSFVRFMIDRFMEDVEFIETIEN